MSKATIISSNMQKIMYRRNNDYKICFLCGKRIRGKFETVETKRGDINYMHKSCIEKELGRYENNRRRITGNNFKC